MSLIQFSVANPRSFALSCRQKELSATTKLAGVGGKQKLLGISKRGNRYLRKLFVQCARAILQQKTKQAPGLKVWLEKMTSHTHRHVAAVALANKLARMAWAVLATGEAYRAPLLTAA